MDNNNDALPKRKTNYFPNSTRDKESEKNKEHHRETAQKRKEKTGHAEQQILKDGVVAHVFPTNKAAATEGGKETLAIPCSFTGCRAGETVEELRSNHKLQRGQEFPFSLPTANGSGDQQSSRNTGDENRKRDRAGRREEKSTCSLFRGSETMAEIPKERESRRTPGIYSGDVPGGESRRSGRSDAYCRGCGGMEMRIAHSEDPPYYGAHCGLCTMGLDRKDESHSHDQKPQTGSRISNERGDKLVPNGLCWEKTPFEENGHHLSTGVWTHCGMCKGVHPAHEQCTTLRLCRVPKNLVSQVGKKVELAIEPTYDPQIKSEDNDSYEYWSWEIEGLVVSESSQQPTVGHPQTGPLQSGGKPDNEKHRSRPPIPPAHYKLHIPQVSGQLKVKKLLASRYHTSAYKKWTSLRNDTVASTSRQYALNGRPGDLEALLGAGVVRPAYMAGFPMKPFLLQEEKGGGRCRVITDVPHLNNILRGKVPARLPSVVKLYHKVLKALCVVSIDFKCFFFQVPLGTRNRTPYTFTVGGKLYRWMVVPMGVTWAVRVAQEIAETFAEYITKGKPSLWTIVYVDNIYIGCDSWQEAKEIVLATRAAADRFRASVEIETWGGDTPGDILGIQFNLATKEARVAPAFYKRHECVWGPVPEGTWDAKALLRWVGVLLRSLYILRVPLYEAQPLLRLLAELARSQAKEQLTGEVEVDQEWRVALEAVQKRTAPNTTAIIRHPRPHEEVTKICYSDASSWGAGWVVATQERLWVGAHKWEAGESLWPQVAREARAAELAVTKFCSSEEKSLLVVDAGALVLAEKKGYSPNPHINAFVKAAFNNNVSVAHVPSSRNIADAPSREREPPKPLTILQEVRALPDTVNNSEKINKQRRSRW